MKNICSRITTKCFYGFWAIKQLFQAAPRESTQLFLLIFLQGVAPGISLILIEKLVSWILSVDAIHITLLPFGLIALWGGMLLFETVASPFISIVRIHLNERMLAHCNILLMEKANSINSLAVFESTKLFDQIQFLKDEAKKRPLNFVYICSGVFKDIVTLSSIMLALSTLNCSLPLWVILAAIPQAISTMLLEKQSWDQMLFRSPESRKMAWLSALTLDDKCAKEIRLFGFGSYIVDRYKRLSESFYNILGKHRPKEMVRSTLLALVTVFSNLAIFIWIILQSKAGFIGAGGIVMSLQAFIMTQIQVSAFMQNLTMFVPVLKFFERLKDFISENICESFAHVFPKTIRSISTIQEKIVFENVSFEYPDGRKALKDVNLQINIGEKIALVGENGAGKSTFVKLLTRLYDPTDGRILVDDTDLREIDIKAWRKLMSAVFQDFGQYHFSARENIALSNLDQIKSSRFLQEAATKGGFNQIAIKLPNGYDTLLGKAFGGTSLSGGEWQKLAMSRAFMRNAEILILDEPTSSLDPKSELDVFQRFAENTQGRITILITHRLGSVKMANRIIVLKSGSIEEQGTHKELIEKGGLYLKMFSMQSKQYSEENNKEELLSSVST